MTVCVSASLHTFLATTRNRVNHSALGLPRTIRRAEISNVFPFLFSPHLNWPPLPNLAESPKLAARDSSWASRSIFDRLRIQWQRILNEKKTGWQEHGGDSTSLTCPSSRFGRLNKPGTFGVRCARNGQVADGEITTVGMFLKCKNLDRPSMAKSGFFFWSSSRSM